MVWLTIITNALGLGLAVVGGLAALVALVNRSHGYALSEVWIKLTHKIHDVLLLAIPLAIIGYWGFFSPGLLLGANLSKLAPLEWFLLGLGWLSGVIYLGGILYRNLRPTPAQLNHKTQEYFDIAAELGTRPFVPGPYFRMTRIPGNECLRLEISEKHLHLPRCPPAWNGLTILHLSDLHLIGTIDRTYFERVIEHVLRQPADLIVFTGDLLDRMHFTEWLPSTLGRLQAQHGCHFILGNRDWYLEPAEIRRQMIRLGWQDATAQTRVMDVAGHPLAMGGLELPWMGTWPDFTRVPPEAFRILLSHTPDHIAWARSQQIDLMLSGHNHGGQIRLPMIGPVYCPSRYGCRYASGEFWETPTFLHVSRGISGKHPWRWRCPPEITRLVLRSP